MNNEKNSVKRTVGPARVQEKPKDLKNALKKLWNYLEKYKVMIFVALILACLSSILSIKGPSKLSDLTDKISDGLIPQQAVIEDIGNLIRKNIDQKTMQDLMKESFKLDLSSQNINKIMSSSEISDDDKQKFNECLENKNIKDIPDTIKRLLLSDSKYNGVEITVDDKIYLINNFSDSNTDLSKIGSISANLASLIFKDFEYKDVLIDANMQKDFLKAISNVSSSDEKIVLKAIDNLPTPIYNLVKPKMDLSGIKKIFYILLSFYLVSALFSFFENFIMATVSNNFARNLRHKISVKINKLPLKYFDSHSYGDILSRVTNDVDTIGTTLSQSLGTLVGAITLFIGSTIMMFVTNVTLSITAILSSIFGFAFMFTILGKSQKYFQAKQVELGNLNGHIEEIYSSHNVVKVYNASNDAKEKFEKLNNKVYECNRKSQFLSGLMPPMMSFMGNFSYVMVCIVGAMLVVKGNITFGVIIAFIIYVRLWTSPLSQIAQGMTNAQTTLAASERVFEFLEEKEMPDESALTDYLDPKTVKGNISFEHVKFGYDEGKTIIKDFNCEVKKGEKIAIVGPTGAGKTTIVNLLMKFYDINSGCIKIDGIPLSKLTRENIHQLFIMVLQDTWLFNGTIRDNIKYNKPDVSDDEIWASLETVGVAHFVKSLPHELDYQITDNESISAGQKQLLTIARGMIEDAPFLILDEATSSVDTRTEELVQKAMDKLTEGRTSFIIAHRLSTIKNADHILVMKDGNIIEQGNHEELLAKNGFYADLYNSQFEN